MGMYRSVHGEWGAARATYEHGQTRLIAMVQHVNYIPSFRALLLLHVLHSRESQCTCAALAIAVPCQVYHLTTACIFSQPRHGLTPDASATDMLPPTWHP
jgi:hypothetical protein